MKSVGKGCYIPSLQFPEEPQNFGVRPFFALKHFGVRPFFALKHFGVRPFFAYKNFGDRRKIKRKGQK